MLDLASVVPGTVEQWLLQTILQPPLSAFDEVIEHGMLNLHNGTLSFRHELARRAIENLLTATHAKDLHAKVLKALIQQDVERIPLARLVHHAAHADDGEAALRYAPIAAQQAGALGAHRQAAAYYKTALQYANQLPAEKRAELLDAYSDECEITDQMTEAKHAQENALLLWRELKRHDKEGRALRRLCEIISNLPQLPEAVNEMRHYIADAITVLETLPPSKELAMAYSVRSRLHMNAQQLNETLYWGSKAIELAEQLGDIETQAHALNNIGQMEITIGQRAEGQAKLEHSLQISLSHGLHYHAARAYLGLASELADVHDYPSALRYFDEGLAYCIQYDLDYWHAAMLAHRSEHMFEQGHWAEAEQEIRITQKLWRELIEETVSGILRVQVRRGDNIAQEAIAAARALACNTPLLAYPCHVAAALAEMAWLHGDLAQCRAEAEPMFQIACQRDAPEETGYLAYWMWRAGAITQPPPNVAEPYALQISGNWQVAASMWEKFGCPYEQAMALMDGDEAAQLAALEIFERLGARPIIENLKQKMRAEGIRGIPRGPRPATRENPFGLTAREMEVLGCLVRGLSNNAIAKQLSLSTRTVEHHIAAILDKMEVESRSEAIALALRHHLPGTE